MWKFFTFFALILGIGLGVFIGQIFQQRSKQDWNRNLPTEEREGGFEFINPLLTCNLFDGPIADEIIPFRTSIKTLLEKRIKVNSVLSASVYFQDLITNQRFGISTEEEFIPASLMKLPVAIELMKLSETHPNILKETLSLKESIPFPGKIQTIKPSQEISPGISYTIMELIERILIYSDNQASALLYEHALPAFQKEGYLNTVTTEQRADIALLNSIVNTTRDAVTVTSYSRLLSLLYNGSFLNHQNSEKLLSILSRIEYRDGLVAGVPPNIVVAHKFGEAGELGGIRQLHDCGIIYYPKRPYLLCVMTKGDKPDMLRTTIRDISEEIYKQVSRSKK